MIFAFFGDFDKFLKIYNSRMAEDIKKYCYPRLSAERVNSEKMVVFQICAKFADLWGKSHITL